MKADWDDQENAVAYRRFAEDFSLYAETSRWLVERASLGRARIVVDLCSGTGATTKAILSAVGPDAQVIALDGAAAMQAEARRHCGDPRVRYVTARAEHLDRHVFEPVDAVVCNSAMWQTNMAEALGAVRRVLAPGGRFVFNIGHTSLRLRREQPPSPQLLDAMRAYAVLDYDFVPRLRPRPDPALTPAEVQQMVADAGFAVEAAEMLERLCPLEEERAWLSVPIFTSTFDPLSHQDRLDCLNKAYEHLMTRREPPAPTTTRWLTVTARQPPHPRPHDGNPTA